MSQNEKEPNKSKQTGETNRMARMQAYRLNRRRAHHEALGDPAHLERMAIPEHPAIAQHEPVLIQDQKSLEDFLNHAAKVGEIAFDTEFIGEASYIPHLCLLQLATHEQLVIVDPLIQAIDLSPIWQMIASPEIRVIVHAGFQDLEPVWRHLSKPPVNIFDTQIAAGFAGLHYPTSLRKLVQHYLELEMPKGLTYTSWDARPLTPQHIHYAADDVRYLLAVAQGLEADLKANSRMQWAQNEFLSLEDPERYGLDIKSQCHRIDSSPYSPPEQKLTLARLIHLRDELSKQLNSPPRSLIKDGLLRNMVKHPPGTLKQLAAMRGMPTPIVDVFGERILSVLYDESAPSPEPAAQKRARLFKKLDRKLEGDHVETLYRQVVHHCELNQVALQMAASRREVEHLHFECILALHTDQFKFAKHDPDEETVELQVLDVNAPLAHVHLVQGWRGEFFEPVILSHVNELKASHRLTKSSKKRKKPSRK